MDDGYGGLEHRSSTALIASRRDLPRLGEPRATDGYVTLLGLISHEYFHTWNVKRLRPAEFAHYDYKQENYSQLLWFFEGFTSYYDDLLLRRAGLIDDATYLKLLTKTCNQVLQTPGREVQSVAQASFDAWVKYYRQDENTANATVSYYTKGSLVALELDLTERMLIRSHEAAEMIQRCKELGLSIMLDDFGTGYSSLGRLSRLPIDGLKIDRSFVGKIEQDSTSRTACAGIIALARQLRIVCVAEGVESEGQLAYLRSQGCDQVQGYLYCRPLDAAALAVWLHARQAPKARLA